jgi:hypothetical protein
MTCYFRKHDRIAVGAMMLPKILKIAFHNINDYSLGEGLNIPIKHIYKYI